MTYVPDRRAHQDQIESCLGVYIHLILIVLPIDYVSWTMYIWSLEICYL